MQRGTVDLANNCVYISRNRLILSSPKANAVRLSEFWTTACFHVSNKIYKNFNFICQQMNKASSMPRKNCNQERSSCGSFHEMSDFIGLIATDKNIVVFPVVVNVVKLTYRLTSRYCFNQYCVLLKYLLILS